MSNYSGQQPELYYSMPAAVTKNTYTAQAVISAVASSSVPRCLIPANYFSLIGKSMHFEANGTIANTAAATFVCAGGLDTAAGTIGGTGGATLFTTAAVTPTSATVCPFTLVFDVVAQAIGNLGTTLQINGEMDVHAAASSSWSAGRQSTMIGNTLTGVNNELSLYLELFGTWNANSVSNTTTLQQFKVYLEN
jgi:hypothetical protein